MIYGAYGYTGTLVAEEAVRRGHRPLLAGRSAEKLAPLAERLGLEWKAIGLDEKALVHAIGDCDLVFHAAGPFVHTAGPMMRACLATATNYLDITGELQVFQELYRHDSTARTQEIVMISGVGFDVVPTDCLAVYLASRLPDATKLELAVDAMTTPSAGTIGSTIESAPHGGWIRRDGKLVQQSLGAGARDQMFTEGMRRIMPLPLGDLESAYRSTGIPTITTYLVLPRAVPPLLRILGPALRSLLKLDTARSMARGIVRMMGSGPDEEARSACRSYMWGRVENKRGESMEGWLETAEAYTFTAAAGVRIVELVLEQRPTGTLTPAQAFGADLVLQIPGSRRYDSLDEISASASRH